MYMYIFALGFVGQTKAWVSSRCHPADEPRTDRTLATMKAIALLCAATSLLASIAAHPVLLHGGTDTTAATCDTNLATKELLTCFYISVT